MLPIYRKLGMSPVVLTCTAGLANGTLNIVPWGGPTVRAAAALKVSPTDIFVPMIPSLLVGIALVMIFAWTMGLRERSRLAALGEARAEGGLDAAGGSGSGSGGSAGGSGSVARRSRRPRDPARRPHHDGPRRSSAPTTAAVSTLGTTMLDPDRETLRPRMIWFNLGLTIVVLALLIMDQLPLAYVFMVGAAIALIANFRDLKHQGERIAAHAPSVVGVVSMVLAAGVLIGVLNGTGMVSAMSAWLVTIIPDALGPGLAVITGVLSIPMTFFMSNDAFYYGMLPVLAESAANYGIDPVEMARASITGQPVHLQSPLVPAILLLVSLADVNLGDHHRKVLWRAVLVSLAMLAVGVLTAVIPI